MKIKDGKIIFEPKDILRILNSKKRAQETNSTQAIHAYDEIIKALREKGYYEIKYKKAS